MAILIDLSWRELLAFAEDLHLVSRYGGYSQLICRGFETFFLSFEYRHAHTLCRHSDHMLKIINKLKIYFQVWIWSLQSTPTSQYFLNWYIYFFFFWSICLFEFVPCVCLVLMDLRSRVIGGCEALRGCLETKLDPQQKQQVVLISLIVSLALKFDFDDAEKWTFWILDWLQSCFENSYW